MMSWQQIGILICRFMLLFDLKKSNKGKTYTRKADIDAVFAEKAEEFNSWFKSNSKELVSYLTGKNYYDCDIFNAAYLKVYDIVLFSGLDLDNYKAYYLRSYFTLLQDAKVYQNRLCELLPNADKADLETDYIYQLEAEIKRLETDIFNYVYEHYDLQEFELFKMYMNLKPAVNYIKLSKITGLKSHNIQRVISKIKKDIRNNKEFKKRRKELL